MIDSGNLNEQVAEARRVIEIKLAQQIDSPPEPINTQEAHTDTPTVASSRRTRTVPVVPIVVGIVLLTIIGAIFAIGMRGRSDPASNDNKHVDGTASVRASASVMSPANTGAIRP
jgi:hypothetical protein